jgi:hypothetical protein
MPIDLIVVDKEFKDEIWLKFPKLRKHFHEDTSDRQQTVWYFCDLSKSDYSDVTPFLEGHKKGFEYEIRNSKTGDFIYVNNLRRKEYKPECN